MQVSMLYRGPLDILEGPSARNVLASSKSWREKYEFLSIIKRP